MSSHAEQGSRSSRSSQKSSATLHSTKSTKSDTSDASRTREASPCTTSSQSTANAPYASTTHNPPSVQLTTYLADPTHSNPGYAYTHTDAFAHIYGFPHDPMLRWDFEDEMILEAQTRTQQELDEFDTMIREAEETDEE